MQSQAEEGQNGLDGGALEGSRAGNVVVDANGFGGADEGNDGGQGHEQPDALGIGNRTPAPCRRGHEEGVKDEQGDEVETGKSETGPQNVSVVGVELAHGGDGGGC